MTEDPHLPAVSGNSMSGINDGDKTALLPTRLLYFTRTHACRLILISTKCTSGVGLRWWAEKDIPLGPVWGARSQGTGWDMEIQPTAKPTARRQARSLTQWARLYPKACSNVGYQPALSKAGKSTPPLLLCDSYTQSFPSPERGEGRIWSLASCHRDGTGQKRRPWI